jgi:hypothetical protein
LSRRTREKVKDIQSLILSLVSIQAESSHLTKPKHTFTIFLIEVAQHLYTRKFIETRSQDNKENFYCELLKSTLLNSELMRRWHSEIVSFFLIVSKNAPWKLYKLVTVLWIQVWLKDWLDKIGALPRQHEEPLRESLKSKN